MTEQYAEKRKLLQDIRDLRADAEEHARVMKLAKKAETEAKKKASDLHLMAMRSSKAGTCKRKSSMNCVCYVSQKGLGGKDAMSLFSVDSYTKNGA